ncbi:MFS transporter [Paenibacillus aquistagni]|uniref:MFS transporter n=1 Tax=Paenibacillus aquistagni TaxID=1852522 RepID=UPI000B50547D|nr:MFS transporter [Paenibacillus aquistagni]
MTRHTTHSSAAAPAGGFNSLRLFTFLLYGGLAIFGSYFPIFLHEEGFSKTEIGWLLAIGPFLSIFANPFWGYMSDRIGNIRRVLLILLLSNIIIVQFLFHTTIYGLLFACTAIFYLFQTPLFSQSNSLILTSIDGTKHKFGAFRMFGSLGWALTAALAGSLFNVLGVGALSYVYALLLTLALLAAMALPRPAGDLQPRIRPAGASVQKTADKQAGSGSLKAVLLSPVFMTFVLLGVLISVPNGINNAFVSLYITDLGGDKSAVGLSIFMSSIFEIVIFLLFDRFLRRKVSSMLLGLTIVGFLYTLRWLLMSIATEPWQVIAIQALHCVTFGGYFYIGTQLTAMLVPPALRTTGQSIYTLTWSSISGTVAGFLGGTLYDRLGPSMVYAWSSLCAFIGAIGFALLTWLVIRSQAKLSSGLDQELSSSS